MADRSARVLSVCTALALVIAGSAGAQVTADGEAGQPQTALRDMKVYCAPGQNPDAYDVSVRDSNGLTVASRPLAAGWGAGRGGRLLGNFALAPGKYHIQVSSSRAPERPRSQQASSSEATEGPLLQQCVIVPEVHPDCPVTTPCELVITSMLPPENRVAQYLLLHFAFGFVAGLALLLDLVGRGAGAGTIVGWLVLSIALSLMAFLYVWLHPELRRFSDKHIGDTWWVNRRERIDKRKRDSIASKSRDAVEE